MSKFLFNIFTGKKTFEGRSLHAIGREQNPYEKAISIIGRTLESYDEDEEIPCFGFGDSMTHLPSSTIPPFFGPIGFSSPNLHP